MKINNISPSNSNHGVAYIQDRRLLVITWAFQLNEMP